MAVGIKLDNHKEIIDYYIAPVEILAVLKDMLKHYYSNSKLQRCLVYVMRNVSLKARSAILGEFK